MTVFPSLHFQHTTDLKHHWRTPAQLECCCSKYLLLHVHIYNFKTLVAARGHSRHTRQPQPQAPKQQTDMNFEEFLPYASSKPQHRLLGCGAATGDTGEKDRTGPILCSLQLCCSHHSLKQHQVWTSDNMAHHGELFDSKMARRTNLY